MQLVNGELPASVLASVPWDMRERVLVSILPDLIKLNNAFRARFGHNLIINDSYRDIATQREYYANPPSGVGTAAKPGKSNHGMGKALDLHITHEEYLWLRENAPLFGFINPAWAHDGKGIEEPWHWEHISSSNVIPDIIVPPVIVPEEDDMFSDADRTVLSNLETKLRRRDLLFLYFRTPDGKPAVANPADGWYAVAPNDEVLNQHRWLMTQLGLVVDGTSVKDWDDILVNVLHTNANGDIIMDPEVFIERREWTFYAGGKFQG